MSGTAAGALGVLHKAKREGFPTESRPVLGMLRQCGFRLAESTKRDFLDAAGEG